jgi:peptide/nickel transport system substrate-binding protein
MAMLLGLVTACSSSSGGGGSSVTDTGNAPVTGASSSGGASGAKRGGTLNVAVYSILANMTPGNIGVAYADSGATAGAVYGYLGYQDPKTGEVHLQFLKSMTPSADFKTWTLVLKPGIKFSDGTPLNAAAIKFNIDKIADPNSGAQSQPIFASWKTTVVDDVTLKIVLPEADSGFPAVMTQMFPWIGSPTAWKKEGKKFATQPVGAGPFKIQSWTQNAQMTLVRNPYYADFAPGQPYLDKVVVKVTTQTSQLMAALRSGQADTAWVQGDGQIKQAKDAGLNVDVTKVGGGEYLVFNTTKPPFNDIRARQAVSYALNHDQLASVWATGNTAPFMNLYAPTSPYYDKKNDFTGTDTAKAKQLFAALKADGVDLSFDFVTTTSYPQVGAYLQATLEKYAGVKLKPRLESIDQYIADGRSNNFDMFAFGATYSNPWPSVKQYFAKGGSSHFGGWDDPAVTKAIKAIGSTTDPSVWKKNYDIIASRMATQYPIYSAQQSSYGFVTAKKVQNIKPIEYGGTALLAQMWVK